jgi:hypothetical protein
MRLPPLFFKLSLSSGQIHPQLQAAPASGNWQVGLDAEKACSSKALTARSREENYFPPRFASIAPRMIAATPGPRSRAMVIRTATRSRRFNAQ